ncbi:MAG: biotin--[acetyl-CoA-carboxylase] ligase [Bacteroidaceae bacterium]|nr:biotin--[acetyl-CoA-carboxylase] ligase [Bacteroidaceae bacterium]
MLHICLDDSPRFRWIELREVDSTNNFLRTYRPPCPTALTVVTAERQTAGRGQAGNTWESATGDNLLCSFLFAPPASIPPTESFVVNQVVALAVRDACAEFAGDVEVKWPNDIYADDRKLAGILIETTMTASSVERVIAGIGINVNQTAWAFADSPLPHPTPTSLRMIGGGEVLVRNVLEQMVGHLQRRIGELERGDVESIRNDYMLHLYRRSGTHRFADSQGEFEARIHAIEPSGHLVLERTDHSLSRYAFKEISFRE